MKLLVAEDREGVAKSAAEAFVSSAAARLADAERFVVALSGGSTPRRFHEVLVASHRERVDWSNVDVFLSDERAVPLDDPASNFRMARESLFDPLAESGLCIHVPRTTATDLDEAAAAYEQALLDATSGSGAADLVFLGMGGDGHTASLFPGFDEPPGLVAAVGAPAETASARRMTFTFEALVRAREIIVLIAGAAKASMFRTIRNETSDLPLAKVLRRRSGRTLIICDEAAAAQLDEESSDDG